MSAIIGCGLHGNDCPLIKEAEIKDRLEYLRGELRQGTMSYGDLAELEGLAAHIDDGDVELLEAAGVPEFPEEDNNHKENN